MPRPLDLSLTATGAVLGTPAYMAPEQHLGRVADARSDQFGFCVALWESLHGVRPFRGESYAETALAVLAGKIEAPPADTRVPRRLADVLRRGLALDPAQRWPDMPSLLAALAPTPRRRWLGVAATACLAGGLALGLAAWRVDEARACSGSAAEIAGVWNDEARAAIAPALTDAPRALAGLDAYAAAWSDAHRDACLDHRRDEQSTALFDARVRCLDQRRKAVAAAVLVLQGPQPGVHLDAAQVVARLPRLEPCADPAFVLAELPPPDDPALAATVAAARERLLTARTRMIAGDLRGAVRVAEEVIADARGLGYRPLLAEALVLLAADDIQVQVDPALFAHLEEAYALAVATRHDAVAAEAFSRRLFFDVIHNDRTDAVAAQLPVARALAERLPDPHAALARAYTVEGILHRATGDRARAAAAFETAAREAGSTAALDPLEAANVRFNVTLTPHDPQRRDQLFAAHEATLAGLVGPEHYITLHHRLLRAGMIADLATAAADLASVCPALDARYPEDIDGRARCHYNLAHLRVRLGDPTAAITELAAVRACAAGQPADHHVHLQADRAAALAALLARDHAAVLVAADAGTAFAAPHREQAWIAAELAELDLTRARALIAVGRAPEATAALERSIAALTAPHPDAAFTLSQLWLSDARALLAAQLPDPRPRRPHPPHPAPPPALTRSAPPADRALTRAVPRWILESMRLATGTTRQLAGGATEDAEAIVHHSPDMPG